MDKDIPEKEKSPSNPPKYCASVFILKNKPMTKLSTTIHTKKRI